MVAKRQPRPPPSWLSLDWYRVELRNITEIKQIRHRHSRSVLVTHEAVFSNHSDHNQYEEIATFEIITNQPNTFFRQYTLFINILFLRHNNAQVKKYCKIKRYIYYRDHAFISLVIKIMVIQSLENAEYHDSKV
jgi:hypothetical protein